MDIRKLPRLSTLPLFKQFVDDGIRIGVDNMSCFISRVHVFPIGPVECVVAIVIFNPAKTKESDELALCTPQDQSWSTLEKKLQKLNDINDVFFHKGKLYVACLKEEEEEEEEQQQLNVGETIIREGSCTIHLTGCDVEVDMMRFVYEGTNPDYLGRYPSVGFSIHERYQIIEHFVESATTCELLVVSAIHALCLNINLTGKGAIETFRCTKTRGFEIRRVAEDDCLEKLSGCSVGGEESIFVGSYGSLSLPASVYGVKAADRVYFAIQSAGILRFDSDDEEVLANLFARDEDDDDDEEEEADDINGEENINNNINVDPPQVDDHDEEVDDDYFSTDYKNRLYCVREQGVFYTQQNRIRTTSVTNLGYLTGSILGWFTPKLFEGHRLMD